MGLTGGSEMKLYEITENMKGLQRLAESGELDEQTLADTMEGLDAEFADKAKAVLQVRQSMLADVDAISMEILRLIDLKKAPQSAADRLSKYLRDGMLLTGTDKLDLGLFKVTLKKAGKKLGSIDESKVNDTFFSVVPAYVKLDKRALLAAAKLEAIDGVELIESERALMIK
jgi:hypothetical protein